MFSVIIATRDRPALLARALRSVAAQGLRDFEVLLVDDSTSAASIRENAGLLRDIVPSGIVVETSASADGLGPGEARNRGMARAGRPFIAFLDDDDEWVDPDWLRRAAAALEQHGLDLLFADQMAVRPDGSVVQRPVWSEDLAERLPAAGMAASDGVFLLSPAQVLLSDGFAHLNTTIVRRRLGWERLGGFDPAIRYEEDRDFFLRAIDQAEGIGYLPLVVARHHVPQARASASSIAAEQKDACRLRVLSKAVEQAKHPAIRERGRRDRSFALQRMSARASAAGQHADAARHGRAALRDRFSARWALLLVGLYLRSALSRRSQAS